VRVTLTHDELRALDADWRAANYLTVGQIYLQENPLLREPLRPEHVKPRLLDHWGTSPGLSLVYVHVNRLIREQKVNAFYLAGPGHGGPAVLANVYLEGTYSEVYPEVGRDAAGMRRLFRQFSTPGGVPMGLMLRDVSTRNAAQKNVRLFCPDETNSNRLGAVYEVEKRCFVGTIIDGDDHVGPEGRVMEVLSEHNCQAELARHRAYIAEHFEDLAEITDWRWSSS
jgi:phosphoketolase